jgi:ketosteroid isomerase-like protein
MSSQNVELVDRALREFITSRRPSDLIAPDSVWDMSGFRGWPDLAEYRGNDGFLEFFAKWTEPYDAWDMDVEQLVDAGGNRVVAVQHQRGRLKGAESWVDLRFAVVYTLADGLVRRMQVFATPEEAFEAARMPE